MPAYEKFILLTETDKLKDDYKCAGLKDVEGDCSGLS
jgi:hypothetical protein